MTKRAVPASSLLSVLTPFLILGALSQAATIPPALPPPPASLPAPTAPLPAPTIEQLFGLPNVRQPRLSPDGRKIAFLFPHEKKMALGVFDRATNESRLILRGEDESIFSFFWKGNERLVFLADVAGNEIQSRPGCLAHLGAYLVEVAAVSGGEVVQTGDSLAQSQQGLEQVAADETGRAGDEPVAWLRTQLLLQRGIVRGGVWLRLGGGQGVQKSSASASKGAAASLGASLGSRSAGQSMSMAGSSQRIARSQAVA